MIRKIVFAVLMFGSAILYSLGGGYLIESIPGHSPVPMDEYLFAVVIFILCKGLIYDLYKDGDATFKVAFLIIPEILLAQGIEKTYSRFRKKNFFMFNF